jgi:hypothetical protein
VARIGEERKMYRILVGKPEGKKLLGRTRRSLEDGIRKDLRLAGRVWGQFGWLRIRTGGGLL